MLVGCLVVKTVTTPFATWTTLLLLLTLHLATNYMAVRSVCMRTLNRQRANIVFAYLLEYDRVLSPKQVSAKERIFEHDGILRDADDKCLGYCKIGVPAYELLERLGSTDRLTRATKIPDGRLLLQLVELFEEESYIVYLEHPSDTTCILLKKGSDTTVQLKAWYHALLLARQNKQGFKYGRDSMDALQSTLVAVRKDWQKVQARLGEAGWDLETAALETTSGSRVSIQGTHTTSSNSIRNHDHTLLLVHVSLLTHCSTRQTRDQWKIDSSTPTPKLAPIFEHQRASVGTLTTDSTNSNSAAGSRRKSSGNGFWNSVMSSRKPSHFQTDSAHSAKIAIYSSTTDCDADDEATMSAEEAPQQQRPVSVHIAVSAPAPATSDSRPMSSESAPFCPRRPNLREILANTAPAPWTLAAFMAYLSNNHCLETLEFTMDAGRYKKHFHRMMNKAPIPGQPTEHDANYVKELWTRLMEAYIQPNGSREVNLPSQVRDPILGHVPANTLPPEPSVLEPAVSKTYELMEESVLVPFLNSVYPQSPVPVSPYYSNNSNESMATTSDEKSSRFGRRSRHSSRGSPPPLSASAVEFSASSYSPPSLNNRKSAPSALTTALSRHRFSTKLSPTSSAPSHSLSAALSTTSSASEAVYIGPGLTDDSGSSGSPINECPMTPPVTPPMSDISGSPKTHRDSGAWKKLGRLSGWKPSRKRSQPGFDLHTT
ncbi:DUF647-domain-containing protein, partial [Aureobasidium melanogenum]